MTLSTTPTTGPSLAHVKNRKACEKYNGPAPKSIAEHSIWQGELFVGKGLCLTALAPI